ncbi:MAG: FHA domain-containing protein [Planctomycetota bacterium]|jgi:hypothetical protein|nr:FHA domain-containing protein [Planctomycetota bacterium]MDP6519503.1 FHA domain-containing protein [Planctomycetota bacterium]MDP6837847.1 FHA domain-containing protein [Planctomycetota bacterium]
MAILILDDGETRRRFRLNDGTITLGSAQDCALRLTAPGVAAQHLEIISERGNVRIKVASGVMPVKVAGRSVSDEAPLRPGTTVSIGEAKLSIQAEDGEQPKPLGSAGARSAGARSRAAEGRAAGARAPATSTTGGARAKGSVQRSRPRAEIKRGLPTWAILAIFAVAIFVAYKLVGSTVESTQGGGFDARTTLVRVTDLINQGEYGAAEIELDRVPATATLSDSMRSSYADLRRRVQEGYAAGEERVHNQAGTEYLETQLKKFERQRLQGQPAPEKVRVFLKRCRHFRETWPTHHDLGWVRRHEGRFKRLVDLSIPPTFVDIAFEVKTMTWAKPRDYGLAFALINEFLNTSGSDERAQALELMDSLTAEREEYFLDRMLQAKYEWENGRKGPAVAWLVSLITRIGEREMEDQAAREMVMLPGIDGWLRGYKTDQVDKYRALMKNEIVAAKAREFGIE